MIRQIDDSDGEEGEESSDYLFKNFSQFFKLAKDLLANAIEKEDFKTIKDLVQNGFSVNQPLSDSDETAVHLAAKKGFLRVIPYLFSKVPDDYNYTDVSGFSYFHVACIAGLKDTVERFIRNGVDVNSGLNSDAHEILQRKFLPLHLAAQNAQLEIVDLLLKHRANIHAIDVDGKTVLHQASGIPEVLGDMLRQRTNDEDVTLESLRDKIIGIQEQSLKIIQLLIDRGCYVNVKDRRGDTPLSSVFVDPSIRIKKKIFGDLKQYDRELESAFFNTSIMVIEEVGAKQCQKLELLLNRGSNFDTRFGEDEDTILHVAIRDSELLKHFEDHKVAPCFLDSWHAEMIEAILNLTPIDVNAKNKRGKTPLDMAVSVLSSDVVRVLLHRGADLSGIEINGLLFPKTRLCLESVNILMDVAEARNRSGIPLSNRENLAILRSFFFHDVNQQIRFFFKRDNDAYLMLQAVMEFGADDIIVKTLEAINMGKSRLMATIACSVGNQYLRKMKFCSLPVSKRVKSCINTILHVDHKSDGKVSSQIQAETERMKTLKLGNDMSLHDILNLPLAEIHSFYKYNEEFNQIFSPLILRTNFSSLLEIIKGFFARSLIRRFVLHVTKNNLCLITPLNEDCCEVLTKYLNIDDIQNLLIATL